MAASLGFSFYVQNFGGYSATYGVLAAVIVLLFYFYISAAVLLFGAEVNSEIYREVAEDGEFGAAPERPNAPRRVFEGPRGSKPPTACGPRWQRRARRVR